MIAESYCLEFLMFGAAWEPASLVLLMVSGMKLFIILCLWSSDVLSLFMMALAIGRKSLK